MPIVTHGRVYFRHIRCPLQSEDAIAEMVALVWLWHVRLAQRGKGATQFVRALATFAARQGHSGQHFTGMERIKDVLSPRAQRLHDFVVVSLPDHSLLGTLMEGQADFQRQVQENVLVAPGATFAI